MNEVKKTILLAEDSVSNRTTISRLLNKFGFQVVECVDGEDAYNKTIELLDKETGPDAIITDIMMPKLSGLEFVELLKKENRIDGTPVIFLTAVAKKEYVLNAARLGAKGYLLKPISREKLQQKCAEVFPDHKFPDEGPD